MHRVYLPVDTCRPHADGVEHEEVKPGVYRKMSVGLEVVSSRECSIQLRTQQVIWPNEEYY